MNTPLDITIVLPIKSAVSRDFEDYFEKAITSIKNQKVSVKELLIVATTEEKLNNHIDGFDFRDFAIDEYENYYDRTYDITHCEYDDDEYEEEDSYNHETHYRCDVCHKVIECKCYFYSE